MTDSLNETEITIIEICLNYDDRESQLSDNYSNGDLEAFARALPELTARQLGSLMTSMQQRGLITEPDPEADGIVWLTDYGVNAYFDHMEAADAASEVNLERARIVEADIAAPSGIISRCTLIRPLSNFAFHVVARNSDYSPRDAAIGEQFTEAELVEAGSNIAVIALL